MKIYKEDACNFLGSYFDAKDITISFLDNLENRALMKKESNFLKTGIPGLNLFPKELIVLAGRPSIGKTGFALSLIDRLSVRNNIPIAYLTTDVIGKEMFGQRLFSIGTLVDNIKLKTKILDPVEKAAINSFGETLYNSPIFFQNIPNCNLDILFEHVGKTIKEKNIKFLIIDDLELFRELVDADKEQYNLELEVLLENIQHFAGIYEIPVLCIWPLPKANGASPLSIKSFYRNMLIPEIADTVLLLDREIPTEFTASQYLNAQLHIIKSQNNSPSFIPMKFDPCTNSFVFKEK